MYINQICLFPISIMKCEKGVSQILQTVKKYEWWLKVKTK